MSRKNVTFERMKVMLLITVRTGEQAESAIAYEGKINPYQGQWRTHERMAITIGTGSLTQYSIANTQSPRQLRAFLCDL